MFIINGFFPNRNFGDDLFLKCAKQIVGDHFLIRNEIRNKAGWWSTLLGVQSYFWLGGTFIDRDSSLKTVFSILIEFSLVKIFGGRLELVAVGFCTDVPWYKKVAQAYIILLSDKVTVRDTVSLGFASRWIQDLELVKDIVVEYHNQIFQKALYEESGRVLVALDKWKTLSLANLIAGELAHYPCEAFFTVPVSEYKRVEQFSVQHQFAKLLGIGEMQCFLSSYSADAVIESILKSHLVVTDRLHVALAAIFFDKQVILFGVSEKLKNIDLLVEPFYLRKLILIVEEQDP